MYGRGVASIAEQIKSHDGPTTREDIKEAQKIQEGFFDGFPKVRKWIEETQKNAKINGYVEDTWGRRRRLPDIQLEPFQITSTKSDSKFNPLLGSKGLYSNENAKLIESYRDQCNKATNKKTVDDIKQKALQDGITIHDNGGFIAQAERQCVNARIQGGAATMSKKAMIAVHNDAEMKKLGFRLLIAVHDELIGECPIENAEACKERLSYLMVHAGLPECEVPMKCDTDAFHHWYLDVYTAELKQDYDKLCKSMSEEEAFKKVCDDRSESLPEDLRKMLD